MATDCKGIKTIKDCPDTACAHPDKNGHPHYFDERLDNQKNIRSNNDTARVRSIQWVKGRAIPKSYTKCGNRDPLKQVGENKKITVGYKGIRET